MTTCSWCSKVVSASDINNLDRCCSLKCKAEMEAYIDKEAKKTQEQKNKLYACHGCGGMFKAEQLNECYLDYGLFYYCGSCI